MKTKIAIWIALIMAVLAVAISVWGVRHDLKQNNLTTGAPPPALNLNVFKSNEVWDVTIYDKNGKEYAIGIVDDIKFPDHQVFITKDADDRVMRAVYIVNDFVIFCNKKRKG